MTTKLCLISNGDNIKLSTLGGYKFHNFYIDSIAIPLTYYNIYDSSFVINYTDNTPLNFNIQIPLGNYSITDLLNNIQIQMTNNGVTMTYTINNLSYIVTMNISGVNFTLTVNNTKLQQYLGMNSNTISSVSNLIVFPNVYDLQRTRFIYVSSQNNFTTGLLTSIDNFYDVMTSRGGNYICAVNVSQNSGNIQSNYFGDLDMSKSFNFSGMVNLILYDENSVVIRLNGSNWSININLY